MPRMVALFSRLPKEERGKIPPDRLVLVDAILPEIVTKLGATVENLGHLHRFLLAYYQDFFERHLLRHLTPRRDPANALDQIRALFSASLHFSDQEHPLEIKLSRFADGIPIREYLVLFGRTVEELRLIDKQPEYQGHPSSRLAALDRYPVVRSPRESFLVPELTVFAKSFPFVLDFSLLELLDRQKYDAFRGVVQELYLRCLAEDRLPECLVIRERTYGKPERAGPDLAIGDVSDRQLILVESKARRMKPETITGMTDEAIDANLTDVYAALERAPAKIEHLYAGLPVYGDVQRSINVTKGKQPICVVVLSNSALLLAELVRQRMRDVASPLHDFSLPFCILSLEAFENALEISRAERIPLGVLLIEHWEAAEKGDPGTPMADMWGGRQPPALSERFVHRYYPD